MIHFQEVEQIQRAALTHVHCDGEIAGWREAAAEHRELSSCSMTHSGGWGAGGSLNRKGICVYLQLVHTGISRNRHSTVKQLLFSC